MHKFSTQLFFFHLHKEIQITLGVKYLASPLSIILIHMFERINVVYYIHKFIPKSFITKTRTRLDGRWNIMRVLLQAVPSIKRKLKVSTNWKTSAKSGCLYKSLLPTRSMRSLNRCSTREEDYFITHSCNPKHFLCQIASLFNKFSFYTHKGCRR